MEEVAIDRLGFTKSDPRPGNARQPGILQSYRMRRPWLVADAVVELLI